MCLIRRLSLFLGMRMICLSVFNPCTEGKPLDLAPGNCNSPAPPNPKACRSGKIGLKPSPNNATAAIGSPKTAEKIKRSDLCSHEHGRDGSFARGCKASPSKLKHDRFSFEGLRQVNLSYLKWCAELVSMVLQTRTPFAAFLSRSIQLSRCTRSNSPAAQTLFPIPIPQLGLFDRKTSSSSSDAIQNRNLAKAVHVIVMSLNYWYAGGKFGDVRHLLRAPSRHHSVLYDRIRSLIRSEGPAEISTMVSAGRRFPELMARLSELTDALTKLGALSNPYEKVFAGFQAPKDDTKDPVLKPYHQTDPSKLKLFGKGSWDPCPYLGDELLVAFREPRSLLHGLPTDEGPKMTDSPEVIAELAEKWDQLGLLYIHDRDIHPNSPVRIFGAYKDDSCHRQIGDRRGQNSLESKVKGPSSDLPSGVDFSELYIDPRTSRLSLATSDRKDFYHQLKVTESKAIANTIGPAVPRSLLKNTNAFGAFLISDSRRKYDRSKHGDGLRKSRGDAPAKKPPDHLWVCFNGRPCRSGGGYRKSQKFTSRLGPSVNYDSLYATEVWAVSSGVGHRRLL